MRMAIIAGADASLKYKQKNPSASDAEIMRYIAEHAGKIAENIDIE